MYSQKSPISLKGARFESAQCTLNRVHHVKKRVRLNTIHKDHTAIRCEANVRCGVNCVVMTSTPNESIHTKKGPVYTQKVPSTYTKMYIYKCFHGEE